MQPGSHTYWKQPGDAGVPPVFVFDGSENVEKAEVLFPTPTRISEEGLQAFGYARDVVFPILITPKDASRPSLLKLEATYAVCQKICIPGHSTATLTLSPSAQAPDAARVDAALAEVPVPISSTLRRELTIAPVKGAAKPTWTLSWAGAPALTDVFADAPEGFYFETKKTDPNKFNLTLAQGVSASRTTSVPVSLVLTTGARSMAVTETLAVPGSTQ